MGDSEVQVVLVVAPAANALFSLFDSLPVLMRLCGSSAAVLALVGEVEVLVELVAVVVVALALPPNIELNIAVGSDTGAPLDGARLRMEGGKVDGGSVV